MKQNLIGKWFLAKPVRAGLMVFVLLSALAVYLTGLRYQVLKNEQRQAALQVAESAKNRLQQSLQYSLSATQALALTINNLGLPDNLDSISASILAVNKYIDALQLVPNGVIRYIYPLEGHEAAIDYNIFADSTRNKEAFKAVKERKLYFAGPLQLKQGGLAVVGRLPVFIGNRFWGFSAVIIRMSTLLKAAGIDSSGETGYYFQLSKRNPDSGIEEYFLPLRNETASKLEVGVPVPDGEWKLSVTPVRNQQLQLGIILVALLSFSLAALGGFFTKYAAKKPAELQQLVLQRTIELDKSEKRNRAIVDALPDLLFVIDSNDRFTDYHNPLGNAAAVQPKQLLGKKLHEILPAALVEEVRTHRDKVISEGEPATHRYKLETERGLRDFEARYVRHGKDEVLLLVRDITEAKEAEERLRQSEVKYRTLVEQATDAIFIADFTGRFIVVNSAGYKLSQYSEEELNRKTIFDLTLPEDLKEKPFQFEELKAGKTTVAERKMLRKDGTVIDVEITARIVANDRFLVFAKDITERKKVQEELMRSREELRQLSNYLENIREEERLNISREIHDELGQQLTNLKMDVSRIGKKWTHDAALKEEMEKLLQLINTVVQTVRRISYQLRPGMLDDLGLVAALEWYSRDFEKRTGIPVHFNSELPDIPLPQNIATGLFRIFQESLTNVARHAEAREVNAGIAVKNDMLLMLIKDNGKGFNAGRIGNKRTLGLLGMKERAMMMQGSYTINSQEGEGTVIEVRVPVPL